MRTRRAQTDSRHVFWRASLLALLFAVGCKGAENDVGDLFPDNGGRTTDNDTDTHTEVVIGSDTGQGDDTASPDGTGTGSLSDIGADTGTTDDALDTTSETGDMQGSDTHPVADAGADGGETGR